MAGIMGEATNLGVFDLCHFALIPPYSNGAVQIRVGLELADMLNQPTGFFLKREPSRQKKYLYRFLRSGLNESGTQGKGPKTPNFSKSALPLTKSPVLPFLAFLAFLVKCFPCEEFLVFLSVFPSSPGFLGVR